MAKSFSNFVLMISQSIILFDGVCNLCNRSVHFVIKRDYKDHFLFASLQSSEAKKILEENNLATSSNNSFFLVENGKLFNKSTAVLKVLKNLKGLWPLAYAFIIIPKFIRDFFYEIIAKNRYRWFGKNEQCMTSVPELKAKFIN